MQSVASPSSLQTDRPSAIPEGAESTKSSWRGKMGKVFSTTFKSAFVGLAAWSVPTAYMCTPVVTDDGFMHCYGRFPKICVLLNTPGALTACVGLTGWWWTGAGMSTVKKICLVAGSLLVIYGTSKLIDML